MGMQIIEKPELGRLLSPHSNQRVPVHNWYSYKHGYSRELPAYLIERFNLPKGSWILDPFCGGGTTLLTCKELGINALGFDILPFSVFLSNVKVSDYDAREMRYQLRIFENAITDGKKGVALPDIPLIKKAFRPAIAEELLSVKSRINGIISPKVRSFFNLGFLSIVESVSNTSKAGGFLRLVERDVSPNSIEDLLLDKLHSMLDSITPIERHTKDREISVFAIIGDARKLPTQREFDAIITSPPYPNRHDYTRIYSLEMIFDFVSSNEELKKIRYATIRSHVEAKKKYDVVGYRKPEVLDNLTKTIERNGTNNPQIIGMIEGYFEDMYLALAEMSRCLKCKGKVGLVISNVRFAGVNIPVDELLAEIGAQVNLVPKEILIARYRGNSSQQMGLYKRNPSRESIIIWEKSE